jgi:hypothetical protein
MMMMMMMIIIIKLFRWKAIMMIQLGRYKFESYEINNIIDIFLNSLKIVSKSIACKNECKINDNIINISSIAFSSFDLNIKLEDKISLINIGRQHTINHINNSKLLIKIICSNVLDKIINKIIF